MDKRISLNFSNCVHVYYKDSSCQRCVDVCPIDGAVFLDDYRVKIDYQKCVSCGACVGECPSQAFTVANFSVEKLLEEDTISCKANIPCLSTLSVEEIVWLALKKGEVVLDSGFCDECFIGGLKETIQKKVEEANYFLEKIGVENTARLENIKYQRENKKEGRRRFLSTFGKAAAGLTFWALMPSLSSFNEDNGEENKVKNIVEEKVPIERRKLLLTELKRLQLPDSYLEEEKVSFTSDKWIDNNKCTNCSVCYNVCPTGALKSGAERLKILFEPRLCIKCKVCHEVCPEDCIHLEKQFSVKTFVKETKTLAQHTMIPCEECLIPFSYKGDTTLCPRCQQMEQEIKDLLEI
ncbi:MAG: 4Fe-4S dicluster domain-containing protein [Aquificae bacterium]|nr:4Fe-4S dicluster domain-containing protein [Aquificota bacterium]